MHARLEIRSGSQAGRSVDLTVPARFSVGRDTGSDWQIQDDGFLSSRHFEISFEATAWILRDLNSANGTFLNGRRVQETRLPRSCTIAAGQTTFAVSVDRNVVEVLSGHQPLYALLDAARTPRIMELLSLATERYECLYNGSSAAHLAACAPYLVELPERSHLLRRIAREGWGQSWGIFFKCGLPFEDIRLHLRRFLMVKDGRGAEYYFRFYDPRVFQVFLANATPQERDEFCGPFERIWADDPAPCAGVAL